MTKSIHSDYFLEILDRSGVVSERISLGENSIVIGRAYNCQVIVDDPYVCPQHIKVSLAENGELHVEDLASVNGLSVYRHGAKKAHLKLKPGSDFFIGSTKLRYRCRNEKISPTRRDHSRQFIFNVLQQPKAIALIIIIPLLQLFYVGWLEQAREVKLHTLLVAPASVFVFLIVWAAFWSLAGKLLVHRAMFFTHLAIISTLVGVTTIVEGLTNYSVFIFDVDVWKIYIQYITGFLITMAIIYMHLHFASRGKPQKLMLASGFVSIVLIALTGYFQFENTSKFSSSPRYSASIKEPMFVIGTVQTTKMFYSSMNDIKQEVNVLIELENK